MSHDDFPELKNLTSPPSDPEHTPTFPPETTIELVLRDVNHLKEDLAEVKRGVGHVKEDSANLLGISRDTNNRVIELGESLTKALAAEVAARQALQSRVMAAEATRVVLPMLALTLGLTSLFFALVAYAK